jgi:hypothetical protein
LGHARGGRGRCRGCVVDRDDEARARHHLRTALQAVGGQERRRRHAVAIGQRLQRLALADGDGRAALGRPAARSAGRSLEGRARAGLGCLPLSRIGPQCRARLATGRSVADARHRRRERRALHLADGGLPDAAGGRRIGTERVGERVRCESLARRTAPGGD